MKYKIALIFYFLIFQLLPSFSQESKYSKKFKISPFLGAIAPFKSEFDRGDHKLSYIQETHGGIIYALDLTSKWSVTASFGPIVKKYHVHFKESFLGDYQYFDLDGNDYDLKFLHRGLMITAGIGYNWRYKRLTLMPFAEARILLVENYYGRKIDLKEIGTNNIRTITSDLIPEENNLSFIGGCKLYLYMTPYFGFFQSTGIIVESNNHQFNNRIENQLYPDDQKNYNYNTGLNGVVINIGMFVGMIK